jgi:23S rRNA (uracil1939-C5)-methyltransferase
LEDFYIQDPVIDATILKLRDILRKLAIEPYDEENNVGEIKNIVIRRGHYSHEMMIIFVTRTKRISRTEDLVHEIVKEIPEVTSIVQNINKKVTNVILGDVNKVLYGEPVIQDQLLGNTYTISPQSFYQVNTEMAEKLYQTGIDFAELKETDVAIDAYCGIGTIGQSFAKKVKKVYGMEIVPEAIEDAKKNAKANGLKNTHYEIGSAETVMKKWVEEGVKANVIFVDPPRKGLTKSFIESCAEVAPEKVVYISCNPSTFARDVVDFAELGYEVVKVQPVDLFPQTHHVELVGLLTKKKNKL